jgi:DNA-binding response OmpR family regulator
MRILVVEDDEGMAFVLEQSLVTEGYVVEKAGTGPDGERLALTHHFDLLILDLGLPGKNGLEVCRTLREQGIAAPILIVTGRVRLEDKVTGLDSGADDYLTKPFECDELLARVRALLRRSTSGALPLRLADLVIDRATRTVRRAGKEIPLTHREYELLESLVTRAGQVVSRQELAQSIWDGQLELESNVIDVTMSHLRGKVDRDTDRRLLHTVRGFGFKADVQE